MPRQRIDFTSVGVGSPPLAQTRENCSGPSPDRPQEKNVLKKAGIIVAAATAGVLAMSSFAFADTKKDNVTNDCTYGNMTGAATGTTTGGDSLLGGVIDNFVSTVTNAGTQANTGNCTNLNVTDVLDQDSNNRTKTWDKSSVKDSFNTNN